MTVTSARARNAAVARAAGAPGHLTPGVPLRPLRTDLVPPVLSFVVYGLPAPQGSKKFSGFRGGKPVLKEVSDGVDPWRESVRQMGLVAIRDWSKTFGRKWVALDEAVMVSLTVTVPDTEAARRRGDIYATGTPDLDKLQRAVGDALAPVPLKPGDGKDLPAAAKAKAREAMMEVRRGLCVLHDDSRIATWGDPMKVYPGTVPSSLTGHSGATIQVWRMRDLDAAATLPLVRAKGGLFMTVKDAYEFAAPVGGWAAVWADPAAVLATPKAPIPIPDSGADGVRVWEPGAARVIASVMALSGPNARVPVLPVGE